MATEKVLFISDATDEQLGKQVKAYGPNRLIMNMTKDLYTGKFYVYDTDGTTFIFTNPKVTINRVMSGTTYHENYIFCTSDVL